MAETTTQQTKRDLIDRLLDHKLILIGKQEYPVRNADSLEMLDYLWIQRVSARMSELFNKEEPTPAEVAEYSKKLDRFCRIVLMAPAEVHDTFTDLQRIQITNFFGQRSPLSGQATTKSAKGKSKSRRTGSKSSRT